MSDAAFQAGREIGFAGGGAQDNPHPAGTAERGHWLAGWHIGRGALIDEERDRRRVRRRTRPASSAPSPAPRRDRQGGFRW